MAPGPGGGERDGAAPALPGDPAAGGEGAFLIGEAAGFISPSSLEGISSALLSAQALAESLGERDPLSAYRRKTHSLRRKLLLKNLKCPAMYQPLLRRAVLASGVTSIRVRREEG